MNEILPLCLKTKIKAKKLHEIGRLYDLLDILFKHLSCHNENTLKIVDVGSGIGHLSRILSFLLNCDVETIEGNAEVRIFVDLKISIKIFDTLL